METINNALILRLEKSVNDGFDKISDMLDSIDSRLRTVETKTERISGEYEVRMTSTEKKAEKNGDSVSELKEKVQGLTDRVNLIMWVGGIAGTIVIGYIIGGLLGLL